MIALKTVIQKIISEKGGVYIFDDMEPLWMSSVRSALQSDSSIRTLIMTDEWIQEILVRHICNPESDSLDNLSCEYNTILITNIEYFAGRADTASLIVSFINRHPEKTFVLCGMGIYNRMGNYFVDSLDQLSNYYQPKGLYLEDDTDKLSLDNYQCGPVSNALLKVYDLIERHVKHISHFLAVVAIAFYMISLGRSVSLTGEFGIDSVAYILPAFMIFVAGLFGVLKNYHKADLFFNYLAIVAVIITLPIYYYSSIEGDDYYYVAYVFNSAATVQAILFVLVFAGVFFLYVNKSKNAVEMLGMVVAVAALFLLYPFEFPTGAYSFSPLYEFPIETVYYKIACIASLWRLCMTTIQSKR